MPIIGFIPPIIMGFIMPFIIPIIMGFIGICDIIGICIACIGFVPRLGGGTTSVSPTVFAAVRRSNVFTDA